MKKSLSICIPIYNYDVRGLIGELEKQLNSIDGDLCLVLMDDGSSDEFRKLNRAVCSQHSYKELEKNIGRSAIRNRLAAEAPSTHLLFLDCDVIIHNSNFLQKYWEKIDDKTAVICGGRVYPDTCPSDYQRLRWNYGIQKESQPANIRNLNPNKSFMTNNFVIRKSLFTQIQFNERLEGYGHEDTLFGIELMNEGIRIQHIENPVLNGDIETNKVFLDKTVQSIKNLASIYKSSDSALKDRLTQQINLLKLYHRTRFIHFLIGPIYQLFGKAIQNNLVAKGKSVLQFQVFKFGELLNAMR